MSSSVERKVKTKEATPNNKNEMIKKQRFAIKYFLNHLKNQENGLLKIADTIRTLDGFQTLVSSLSHSKEREIIERLTLLQFQAGSIVYEKMEDSTAAFIVLSGRIRLQDTRSSKAVAISDISKLRDTLEQEDKEEDKMVLMGKIFGLSDLLKNSNRLQFAICREDSYLLRITKEDFYDIRDQIDKDIRQNFESVYKFLPEIRFVATSVQEKVVTLFDRVSYPRGHFIINEGQEADVVYYICDGDCSLTKTVGDEFRRETLSIASLGPGASIGEEVLLKPKEKCMYKFSCQVESNRVVIYKISRDRLGKLPKAVVSKMSKKARIKADFFEERLATFEDSAETKFKKEVKKKEYLMKFPLISSPSVRKLEKCQEYNNSMHFRKDSQSTDPIIESQKINFKRNYSLMTFVSGRKENISPTSLLSSVVGNHRQQRQQSQQSSNLPSSLQTIPSGITHSASLQTLIPYMSSPKNLTLSETLQADADKVRNYIEKSKEEEQRHYPEFQLLPRHRGSNQRKNLSGMSFHQRTPSKLGPKKTGRAGSQRVHNIHTQKSTQQQHHSLEPSQSRRSIPILKANAKNFSSSTRRVARLSPTNQNINLGTAMTARQTPVPGGKTVNPLRLFTPTQDSEEVTLSRSPSHFHSSRRVYPAVHSERGSLRYGPGIPYLKSPGNASDWADDPGHRDDSTVMNAFHIVGLEANHPRTMSSLN